MDFIQVGGKSRPVKYGWSAVAEFCKLTGIGLDNIGFSKKGGVEISMQIVDILMLIFIGLKHGARVEKQEIDFTIEDVGDWMDSEGIEKMNEFMKLFVDQMPQLKKKEK